jgi:hypothetical protein
MMVLGWLLFGPRPRIDRSVVMWSLLWPALWIGYTLVHGAASKWFPYPFLDVPTHGYARVFLNALLVVAVLGLVAMLYAFGDRKMQRAPDPVAIRTG